MFGVKVHFELTQDEDGYPPVAVESVWASPASGSNEFILDNVPFFASVATVGDTVRTYEKDGHRWFDSVVCRSRNSLLRLVFFDPAAEDRVRNALGALRCSTEYLRDQKLMAISVPGDVNLIDVQAYLQAEAESGVIDYEEPILRQSL